MALTINQKAYINTLSGEAKTTYINSVYDTISETANTSKSKYAEKKAIERANIKANTKKLNP